MESLFPQLFFLSFVAPIIIRVAIAGVFLYDAIKIWKSEGPKWPAPVWLVMGVLIGVGFLTQLAVIIAAVHIIFLAFSKGSASVFKNNVTAILALAILLMLLVTGAGGIAIDLPY
jgi:hypothetical protein